MMPSLEAATGDVGDALLPETDGKAGLKRLNRQRIPRAAADAVDRHRFSKPSCPAQLILFL